MDVFCVPTGPTKSTISKGINLINTECMIFLSK